MITPLTESFRSFLVRGDSVRRVQNDNLLRFRLCGTVSKRRLVFDGHDDQLPHLFAALPYTRATVHEIDNGIGRFAPLLSCPTPFFLQLHFTLLFRPGTKLRLQKLQFFYTADQFFTNETHPTVYLLQVKFDFRLNLN